MKYKVIPFVPSTSRNSATSEDVAGQLEEIINQNTQDGWKYYSLENITTFINPTSGCFGFSAKPGYETTRQLIIFVKD